jgi:hypothetical protein
MKDHVYLEEQCQQRMQAKEEKRLEREAEQQRRRETPGT